MAIAANTKLTRHFGLLPATALNMTNMMGAGPFITIPLLMSAMAGPQAMLGWIVALVIVICDGMVWSELGAAMPGSGGSFHYLRQAFGPERFGRLIGFLFVWQFVLSGPLEIASGYIGFANYATYIWKGLTRTDVLVLIAVVGLINIALLYRRIQSIATITISLWAGTLVTVLAVIITGATNFNPRIAFDFPPGAFDFSLGFFLGLGAATRIGIYDYLGYYDVCYIGDEVRDPGRVIPRSIVISTIAVALIYMAINLSIIGTISWRDFVPASAHPESNFIVSTMMERIYGTRVATIFTLLILWTAFGSVFALLLGYSRIPYAAAESGYFFGMFGRLHPTAHFPHRSLLVIGAISIVAGFFSLGTVIDALIVTRILVQFMGQIVGVMLLRRTAPSMPRPYRIWLYPVPALVALLGWIFVFATTDIRVILFGLAVLGLGCVAFLLWSRSTRRWPFAIAAPVVICALALNSLSAQTAEPFTAADIIRAQLERSWIHPGYIGKQRAYVWGPDSLLFETSVAPHFAVVDYRGRPLRKVLPPVKAIVFSPKVELRMLITESEPVRTPSYKPNVVAFLESPWRDSTESIVVRVSHFSNGQEEEPMENGVLNEKTGNFNTNFWQLGYSKAFVKPDEFIFIVPTFVEAHFGQAPSEFKLYGQYRSRLSVMVLRSPTDASLQGPRDQTLWQLDLGYAWDSPLRTGFKRLEASLGWAWMPPRAGDLGLFVSAAYWGADYYNIQYHNGDLVALRIGLVANSVRYRFLMTSPER